MSCRTTSEAYWGDIMKKTTSGRRLPPARRHELLEILKDRFEKNAPRHAGIRWEAVQARLEASAEKLWSRAPACHDAAATEPRRTVISVNTYLLVR